MAKPARKKRARIPMPPSRLEQLQLLGRILARMSKRPGLSLKHLGGFGREVAQLIRGKSTIAPARGDRRFSDPMWNEGRLSRVMVQLYLAASREAAALVEELELQGRDASSARFLSMFLIDALAPSNNPLTNPVVRQEIQSTRGKSLARGMQNLLSDRLDNAGMISMVDKTPFRVGENVACTEGQVVFRNEVLELIQYQPKTDKVYEIPLLIVPPQINKFYVLDLSPGNSFVKYAVEQGFQVFILSWINPEPQQAYLSLQHYLLALEEAHEAVMEITGASKVSFKGLCAGGITASVALARYADQGKLDTVNSLSLNVTLLDISGMEQTNMGYFMTPAGLETSVQRSKKEGVLHGYELAKMFAWLRPNDLVWNYWVNNYLMGNKPPAFDVLYWNSDSTRMPAKLHADFVELLKHNPLGKGEPLELEDASAELKRVDVDNFIIAGLTDHITPWKECYRSVHLLGGDSRFVLVNSGHIQTLVSPPGKGKASYQLAEELPEDPDQWHESSEKTQGSWWEPWVEWASQRSGKKVKAPEQLGSKTHEPLCAAPGTYVVT